MHRAEAKLQLIRQILVFGCHATSSWGSRPIIFRASKHMPRALPRPDVTSRAGALYTRHMRRLIILTPARLDYPDEYSAHADYAVLHHRKIVGRIVKESSSGNAERWKWSFKRKGTDGYDMGDTESLQDAMRAFRRAWQVR